MVHWKIQYLGGQGVTVRRFKGEGLGKKEGLIPQCTLWLHKKWSFPLRISSVNGQIHRKVPIGSHLLKKSLIENFIFCVAVLLYSPFPYTLNAYQNKLAYNHTRTYATGFRIFFGGEALVLATRTLKAFCNDWPWLKMFSMKIQMFIMRYVNDH